MAKKVSIEEKLKSLSTLQMIDSALDEIRILRGSLPDEVADLEDDLEGLNSRKEKIEAEINELQEGISEKKNNIKEFSGQIKKYETQMDLVKNNREFEALSKEIEYANLEILTSEKRIRQYSDQIEQKNILLGNVNEQVDERGKDLEDKKKELVVIISETEKEEQVLLQDSEKAGKKIEPGVLKAYRNIRNNMRNGLAVVYIDRNACGGCSCIIPPQIQLIMRQKKETVFCENCGRIMIDGSFFGEEKPEVEIV